MFRVIVNKCLQRFFTRRDIAQATLANTNRKLRVWFQVAVIVLLQEGVQ